MSKGMNMDSKVFAGENMEQVYDEVDSNPYPNNDAEDLTESKKLRRSKSVFQMSRGESVKMVVDHVDEHKHKYGVCAIVSVAVIVPCCILLIAATIYHFTHISHDKQVAAIKGTTIPFISALPSKGDSTKVAQSQRRLNFKPNQNLRERLIGRSFLKLDDALDPSTFDDLSDYSLFLDPQYVVGDPAASHVDFVNMISCWTGQMLVKDVMILAPGVPYKAVIDEKLCKSVRGCGNKEGQPRCSFIEFAVKSTGPDGLGDGTYFTEATFMMPVDDRNSYLTHMDFTNEVIDGKLSKSVIRIYQKSDYYEYVVLVDVDLSVEDYVKVVFVQDGTSTFDGGSGTGDAPRKGINYLQESSSKVPSFEPTSGRNYLVASYNKVKSEGSAISYSMSEGAMYELRFNNDAYMRTRTNEVSQEKTSSCIDFSIDSRILVGQEYTLFSAADGTKKDITQGFIVQKDVAEFDYPLQGWASMYGFWPMGGFKNGEYVWDTNSYFRSGDEVEKVNYAGGANSKYTMEFVNSKLDMIAVNSITLGDIKGMEFYIFGSSDWNLMASWNGNNFVKSTTTKYSCSAFDYSTFQFTNVPTGDVEIDSYSDCWCLTFDEGGDFIEMKDSGEFSYYYNGNWINSQQTTVKADEVTNVDITAKDFPWGISVASKAYSMYGTVEVMYEDLQTMYCVYYQEYTKGLVISQPDTGASGKVYKSTSMLLMGWNAGDWSPDSGKITYTYLSPWRYDCSSSGSPSTSSVLHEGLILKQVNNGVIIFEGVVADGWCMMNEWSGCRVDVTSGQVDPTKSLEVFFPPDSSTVLSQNNYVHASGTIPVGEQSGLQYWNGVVITTNADKCTKDGSDYYWPSFNVTLEGVAGASVTYWSDGHGNGYAYVGTTGSGCIAPVATVTVEDGVTCDLPILKLTCMVGARAEDTVVQVLLDDSGKRFERGKPILYDANNDEDFSDEGEQFESCWISDAKGDAIPLTDNTRILYKTYSTVQANNDDINLICYNGWSGCPAWNDGRVETAEWPSHLSDNAEITVTGSCDAKPTVTFKDIGGSPEATLVWDEDEKTNKFMLKSFTLVDRGNICSSSTPPTVTFKDGLCEPTPSVTISCQSGSYTNDLADYRGANKYKYNAFTGILTDNEGNTLLDDNQQYGQYDVFFEDTSAVRNALLCDWDKSQVCSYQYYAKNIDSYTFSVGTSARRVTLANGESPLVFSNPINVIYEHKGDSSNDGKSYDGLKNMLTYSGPGSLWGLPQVCFDKSSMNIKDTCNWYTDLQLDALFIPSDNPLEDVVNGYKYYAKTSSVKEFYPQAANDAICVGLDQAELPEAPSKELEKPKNYLESYPSLDTMKDSFLNGGIPIVVGGVLTTTEVSV